MIYAEI